MPSVNPQSRPFKEVELKLALPPIDGAALIRQLAHTAVLRRHKMRTIALHNIYFDTPDQRLRQQHAALRLRRVGDGEQAQWLQTLKTGKPTHSALSQRGEWESPVCGPQLSLEALDRAAWSRLDPQDTIFGALQPLFITDFERSLWLLQRRDGSVVEVALDLGKVSGADHSSAICELELELKAGPVSALFDVADAIAKRVAVLPLAMSKAQRGYALASGSIDAPVKARAPGLWRGMTLPDTARSVLQEMFGHFTANLAALRCSDDPEVVHQARIAWRRFRSARRLFKSVLGGADLPLWHHLDPLLAALGQTRDLDVARHETLPAWRSAYVAHSCLREQEWDELQRQLSQRADDRRATIRHLLQDPSIGTCLLQTTRWLDADWPAAGGSALPASDSPSLRQWATRRARRLHERFQQAHKNAHDLASRHATRILAKRARYNIDALRDVLPRHITHKWYQQAVEAQKSIGSDRDLHQAIVLLTRLEASPEILAFLRGVAAGRGTPFPHFAQE